MNFSPVKTTALRILSLFLILLFLGCATQKAQYGAGSHTSQQSDTIVTRGKFHRFFLIGDAGYAAAPNTQEMFSIIGPKLKPKGEDASLLFLGDNIYPLGMPPKKQKKKRKLAEEGLMAQLMLGKDNGVKTYFIPGNHDWYNGLDGLLAEEDFVRKHLDDKNAFLPGKGCPLNEVKISSGITMIAVDSQWFIEDWDNYPNINDDCDIKTREAMFNELESLLNKNQDKVIVLAIHHPLMTSGAHGGQFSMEKQFFPLKYKVPMPGLGSVINLARKTSGYSTQDIQSRLYNMLSRRIRTMLQDKFNVIVVSGHDHNLQYIEKDNIRQIISGAGSKEEAVRVAGPKDFSYGRNGYTILDVYANGTAKASFFGISDGKEVLLFEKELLVKEKVEIPDYPDRFDPVIRATVMPGELTHKSRLHNFLFGTHYRSYYGLPVAANVAMLDTLRGGLEPFRSGGGHQSNSLRLKDKDGKEYVLRGLRKSAIKFLQASAFRDQYIGDSFDGTFTEKFLLDFYTTAHPFTPFILDDLAETAGIYHTNPQMMYVPKQDALKEFNLEYGDELYMLEERPEDSQKQLASFGKPDGIDGTDDVMINLQKDSKYKIDEKAYIRARLFDMLIGDWDRHADQWRWARFETKDSITYRPIPRDHDQAFPKYGGKLLTLLLNIPALRSMESYDDHIHKVKWLNRSAYPLDLAFITKSGEDVWQSQAAWLKAHLTPEAVNRAFAALPAEVSNDAETAVIKNNLIARLASLQDEAMRYRDVLLRTVLIRGTDKKEKFVITRLEEGKTNLKVFRLKDDKQELVAETEYSKEKTKELWIYGLDGKDEFEVKGIPVHPVTIRLLGGPDEDVYTVENGQAVKVYDFKSKKNTYNTDSRTRLVLTDDYETNSYNYKKPDYNIVAGYPLAGFNPDDGLKLGAVANYTINNFNRRPYSRRHSVSAMYYFATGGFELGYKGNFMNVANKWNFGIDMQYTSPNFSINYFGYGNESVNNDEQTGMDYNRVKLQIFRGAASFFKESRNGGKAEFGASFETIEIESSEGRFIARQGVVPSHVFEHRQFAGAMARYSFGNYDIQSLPSMGLAFHLEAGYRISADEAKRSFPYTDARLNLVHKITANNRLVFETTFSGRALFNNNFEIYQAAVLGGNDLRSFRRERFTGRTAYSQSSDIRFTVGTLKNSIIPAKYGFFAGYDYGRVWIDNDVSRKWHQSAGGGLFLNGVNLVTARAQYFYGADGGRVSVGFRFGF